MAERVQVNPYESLRKPTTGLAAMQPTVAPGNGGGGQDNSAALLGLLAQLMQGGGRTNAGSQQAQGGQQLPPPQSAFVFPQQQPQQAPGEFSQSFIGSNYGLGQNSPAANAYMDRENARWWSQQRQPSPVGQAIASGPQPIAPADTYGETPYQSGVTRIPGTGEAWSSPGFGAGLYSLGNGSPMPADAYTDYGPRKWWGEN